MPRLTADKAPLWTAALLCTLSMFATAQDASGDETLFTNARIYDGRSDRLGPPTSLLVRGNQIVAVGDHVQAGQDAVIIDGNGYTLTRGCFDRRAREPAVRGQPDQADGRRRHLVGLRSGRRGSIHAR
jgi:hypothetical protein